MNAAVETVKNRDQFSTLSDQLPIVDAEIMEHLETLPINFWDFVEHDKGCTHNIHSYPAMMIPPIPHHLIAIFKRYQPEIKNVLDPFVGSGTVLLESVLAGLNAWGIDLNPLACLIAKAKCTPLHPEILQKNKEKLMKKILTDISKLKGGKLEPDVPAFKNIGFWFKPYVIKQLQMIKQGIRKIESKDVRTLFGVAFSETVRDCSNTRNSEFKLYRMPEEKLAKFNPAVAEIFAANLEKCIQSMADFYQNYKQDCWVTILAKDARDFSLEEKIDLMITSPPYGDSRTTVAYGQFSRLSLQWLDLEGDHYVARQINKSSLDKYLLGGSNNVKKNNLPSDKLMETLQAIAKADEKRALEVLSFYVDLDQCMQSITKCMKVNSYQCWVVGNRTVKKVTIPTNAIICELGTQYNLKTIATIPRNIPQKKMPKENSPTNVRGEKVTTMNKENIVILRKVK